MSAVCACMLDFVCEIYINHEATLKKEYNLKWVESLKERLSYVCHGISRDGGCAYGKVLDRGRISLSLFFLS